MTEQKDRVHNGKLHNYIFKTYLYVEDVQTPSVADLYYKSGSLHNRVVTENTNQHLKGL
jgi:hypothetical protein